MEINPYAHSAWVLKRDDQVVKQSGGSVCYSEITYGNGLQADYLKIYFGQLKIANAHGAKEWCDWVINRSIFRDAFVTKDAEDGLANGFEVNTHCERLLMQSGMIALRRMFEDDSWSWFHFVELGYSEFDAFVLASNAVVDIDNQLLMQGYHNTNHLAIQPHNSYETYQGKYYTPPNTQTLAEGFVGRIHMYEGWGCKSIYIWPELCLWLNDDLQFSKENCNKILQKLKEL